MDYLEQFQAYLLSRDKSPKTIQGYGADLRQFQKWVGRSLETITPADVRWYRDHLISIGASANTINRHLLHERGMRVMHFVEWASKFW